MIKALESSGRAMQVQLRRHELIANNLANVTTTGFKKLFAQVAQETAQPAAPGGAATRRLSVGSATSSVQGPLQSTGNPLDAALMGDGYFEVETPDGPRLSRDGAFSLGPNGELLHSSGNPVLADGSPVRIETVGSILPDGTVLDGDRPVGRLSVVRPVAGSALLRRGDNLLEAPGGTEPVPEGETQVLAGRVEGSNVEAVEEMVDMIRAFRAYEMAQKAAQAADDTLRVAVERVGAVRA